MSATSLLFPLAVSLRGPPGSEGPHSQQKAAQDFRNTSFWDGQLALRSDVPGFWRTGAQPWWAEVFQGGHSRLADGGQGLLFSRMPFSFVSHSSCLGPPRLHPSKFRETGIRGCYLCGQEGNRAVPLISLVLEQQQAQSPVMSWLYREQGHRHTGGQRWVLHSGVLALRCSGWHKPRGAEQRGACAGECGQPSEWRPGTWGRGRSRA